MKFLNAVLIVLIGHFSYAQKCVIVDKDSEFPISNVQITNEARTISVVSDRNGIADLSDFEEMELLIFHHVSYVELELLKKHIRKDFTTVFLQYKSELLKEVFLSSAMGDVERNRIAEEVAVFSSKDIQRAVPQTSADMLAEIPGVKVQKTQFGGGSPVLRGMEANRILLVVDGVRMNNAIYRKGHLQNSITVSPSQLDKTEVIFGPSSVVYGSDALGGVIHYYTRKPEVSERNTVNLDFLGRYSTVNDEKTVNASVELQFEKIASFTSISHSSFGDLRMGEYRPHGFSNWGLQYEYSDNTKTFYNPEPVLNSNPNVQRNVGFEQTDILQKLFLPFENGSDLMFNLQFSTSSDINRFDKLTERKDGKLRFAEWYYGPQDRFLFSTQYHISPNKKFMDIGGFTLAYQNIKESRISRKFDSFDRSSQFERVQVFSLNGDFTKKMAPEINRDFGYGFEVAYNDVRSTSRGDVLQVEGNEIIGVEENFVVQTRYPDGGSSYLSSAVYASYRQDLGKKSTLNTGLRVTNTILNAKWVDTTYIKLPESDIQSMNTAVTLTAGYAYKPNPNWQINGVFSSGFRSPNIDDIGKVREKRGDVTVPNADLQPEFAYNFEAGLIKYFDEKKTFLGLTGYYTLLNNYIVRAPFVLNGSSQIIYDGELSNVVANVNKGNAYLIGGTLTFKGQLTNTWNTRTTITYTEGNTYDTKEPLSSIPPLFGRVEFNYVRNRVETGVNMVFNGIKKAEDYNLSEGIDNIEQTPFLIDQDTYYGSPPWYTLNYYMRFKTSKYVDLLINVDNIMDHHYKEFASAISAPGRNFSFTVIGNF
ncbi:TonB-dependent receptor plug domain-containing protein [Lutimonas zeaxanthinifaciens]|uniref:TonB-dependent receptor plug domain-containing protein n=1 Tax=Lutimonas zeaxanthinifaciens TaxID=3060215 RepID=UPI00265C8FC4|nr:TonB-dependent receptor [Lutimonas sp. YSD2104]WKK66044.1 TonB-dependent receptor [Lutimonas sp. YSD2104]